MAPEILKGAKYDAKVDLWSLGAILHELIYGRPPFKAQNHVDLLKKIERYSIQLPFNLTEATGLYAFLARIS